jgi:hypothetical protein
MIRPPLRTTHTYAIMVLSPKAYREIRQNLVDAGWNQAIHDGSNGEVLDMQGVGIMESEEEEEGGGTEG